MQQLFSKKFIKKAEIFLSSVPRVRTTQYIVFLAAYRQICKAFSPQKSSVTPTPYIIYIIVWDFSALKQKSIVLPSFARQIK